MAVILGAYELEVELGRGGAGRVFRARHLPTGAERAVKVLESPSDLEALARFRREAAALAQGGGVGVVVVHESGFHEGKLYFAMDLMRGGSLAAKLKERVRLPWREAVALVASLGRSLARYHERALVHRDLKPANVLFDDEGRPLLADFGLVRDPDAPALTESGIYVGTPAYSAPEQLAGTRVGPPADVFSLGVVLYEAVAGELPHGGTTLYSIANAARAGKRRSLAGLAGAPEQLDQILARALDPESTRRYQESGALAAALESLLAGGAPEPVSRAGCFLAVVIGVLGLALAASFLVGPHPGRGDPSGAGPSGPLQPSHPRVPPREAPEGARLALAKTVHDLVELSHYQQADRVCEDAIATVGSGFALGLEAETSLDAGDVEGALRLSVRALEANDGEARAFAVEADVASRRHDRRGAIALATSAIACGDSVARARAVRAASYPDLAAEALDGVIADGERALALQPLESPRFFEILSKAYSLRVLAAGDRAHAVRDEQTAMRYSAAVEDARRRPLRPDEALVMAAFAASTSKDTETTIAKATEAIGLNDRRGSAFALRGQFRSKKNRGRPDLDAGIADLERARALDLFDLEARRHLADAIASRARARITEGEDRAAALADAERALDLDAQSFDALRVRAQLRRDTDRAGAISDLKRSIEVAPAARDADDVRKELEELERP